MIDFYVTPSPSVLRIYIMLEECGLAYREHYVDVWRGEQFTRDFAAINPLRKVPAIIDQEGLGGEPVRLGESGAILLYLAEKSQAFLPTQGASRANCLEWLMFAVSTLGPMFGQYNHFRQFTIDQPYSLSRYRTEVFRIYGILEARLEAGPYLSAIYSVADIAAYAWLFAMEQQFNADGDGPAPSRRPVLARWLDAIGQRPAVASAKARFLALPSTLAMANDDELDRVFGRGIYATPAYPNHEVSLL